MHLRSHAVLLGAFLSALAAASAGEFDVKLEVR